MCIRDRCVHAEAFPVEPTAKGVDTTPDESTADIPSSVPGIITKEETVGTVADSADGVGVKDGNEPGSGDDDTANVQQQGGSNMTVETVAADAVAGSVKTAVAVFEQQVVAQRAQPNTLAAKTEQPEEGNAGEAIAVNVRETKILPRTELPPGVCSTDAQCMKDAMALLYQEADLAMMQRFAEGMDSLPVDNTFLEWVEYLESKATITGMDILVTHFVMNRGSMYMNQMVQGEDATMGMKLVKI